MPHALIKLHRQTEKTPFNCVFFFNCSCPSQPLTVSTGIFGSVLDQFAVAAQKLCSSQALKLSDPLLYDLSFWLCTIMVLCPEEFKMRIKNNVLGTDFPQIFQVCPASSQELQVRFSSGLQWASGLILWKQQVRSLEANRLIFLGTLTEMLKASSCADCPQRDQSVWHTEFTLQA